MFGDDGGKTEAATPRRREEARKKGTVVRSVEVVNALAILAILMVLPAASSQYWAVTRSTIRMAFGNLPTELTAASAKTSILASLTPAIPPLLMILATAMVVGVIANVAQVGFKPSAQILSPSLAKLNPLEGIKRLFSGHSAFDTLKACAKTFVFGLLAYTVVRDSIPVLIKLNSVPAMVATGVIGEIVRSIAMRVIGAWLALAAIDYFIQFKQHEKRLRMTLEEVKREMKDDMGDPRVRAERMRRFRRRMRNSVSAAAKADVIITNPTHYAIALVYEQGKHSAPIVVAKGVDAIAAKIREVATENKVPIVPNPPLARALYKQCEVGDSVPSELVMAVAEVLAYVYQTLGVKKPR